MATGSTAYLVELYKGRPGYMSPACSSGYVMAHAKKDCSHLLKSRGVIPLANLGQAIAAGARLCRTCRE